MPDYLMLNGRKCYYFSSRYFSKGKDSFEIIESTATGPGAHDVTHRVKNLKTGAVKPIPMTKLIRLLI